MRNNCRTTHITINNGMFELNLRFEGWAEKEKEINTHLRSYPLSTSSRSIFLSYCKYFASKWIVPICAREPHGFFVWLTSLAIISSYINSLGTTKTKSRTYTFRFVQNMFLLLSLFLIYCYSLATFITKYFDYANQNLFSLWYVVVICLFFSFYILFWRTTTESPSILFRSIFIFPFELWLWITYRFR